MELLVEDALRLWKDIPPTSLTEAVEAGIIQAGGFVATAGLVAKVWHEKAKKLPELDHAAIGRRDQDAERRYLASPENRLPTEAEREANAAAAAEIARKLAGGA
jgi:F0F1-type ATP synthase epsilon subunit